MKISNPKLAPGVRLYERGNSQVQIGVDPDSAIVIDQKVGQIIGKRLNGAHSVSELWPQLSIK